MIDQLFHQTDLQDTLHFQRSTMALGQILLLQQLSRSIENTVLPFVRPNRQSQSMKAIQLFHHLLDHFAMVLGNKVRLFLTQPFRDIVAICEW